MILVVAAFAMTLAPNSAHAEVVSGFLRNSPTGDLSLIVRGSRDPLKITAPANLLNSLRKLRDGNIITGSGTIKLSEKIVQIDAVHSVGLQELLGSWRSSRWEIFEFKDYTRLNLYLQTAENRDAVALAQTHALNYVVVPEREGRYSIFISDNTARLMAGTLQLNEKDRTATLTVYDDKTLKVSEKISLSPLSVK
jgi:hypothetical protein